MLLKLLNYVLKLLLNLMNYYMKVLLLKLINNYLRNAVKALKPLYLTLLLKLLNYYLKLLLKFTKYSIRNDVQAPKQLNLS